jgi:hypothetical protein
VLVDLNYAATFWFEHLHVAREDAMVRWAFGDDGVVTTFFQTRFLEWLECLSWLDELARGIEALSKVVGA